MKLPTLRELFPEQWTVYDHPVAEPLFVVGPPGSGKTSLAVLRAIFLVNQGQTVMVVTRNRMLAALAAHLGSGADFHATTMHTLVSSDHAKRFDRFAPEPIRYQYDWSAIIELYATNDIIPRYDHIIVDEGQNLPSLFFSWARQFGGRCLTVFADEHQATCQQTSSLIEILTHGALPEPIRLTTNHRNTPEIAAVAEHFHRSTLLPPAVVRRPQGDEKPRLISVSSLDALATRIATRFKNRREAIGVILRMKNSAQHLHATLRGKLDSADRIQYYTSDAAQGSEALITILEPGITVLTGESVIGLEFDTVYLVDIARSLPCGKARDRRRMYMLCARARNALFLVDGLPTLDSHQLAALPNETLLAR